MIYLSGHKLIDDSDWKNTNAGTNLWAISQVKPGYLSAKDGSYYSDDVDVSTVIPLSNTSKFVFTVFDYELLGNDDRQKCIFYDSNENFLSKQTLLAGVNSIPASNAKYLGISLNLSSLDNTFKPNNQMQWIKTNKIKLELGSIATQWSPAPQDLVTQSDLDDLKAQIEQLKSK